MTDSSTPRLAVETAKKEYIVWMRGSASKLYLSLGLSLYWTPLIAKAQRFTLRKAQQIARDNPPARVEKVQDGET